MYWGFSAIFQMFAVLERLSQVLMMDEVVKEREDLNYKYEDVGIHIKDGAYTWGYQAEQETKVAENAKKLKQVIKDTTPVLSEINFKLGHSDLLLVAGRIGTGKTTLLFSILDETIKKGGT